MWARGHCTVTGIDAEVGQIRTGEFALELHFQRVDRNAEDATPADVGIDGAVGAGSRREQHGQPGLRTDDFALGTVLHTVMQVRNNEHRAGDVLRQAPSGGHLLDSGIAAQLTLADERGNHENRHLEQKCQAGDREQAHHRRLPGRGEEGGP